MCIMLGMAEKHPRKLLTDELWERLEPLVAQAKHSRAGAPSELTERAFIEAILYLNRTGCPWRDLPSQLGYWHAVYMRLEWPSAHLEHQMVHTHIPETFRIDLLNSCLQPPS